MSNPTTLLQLYSGIATHGLKIFHILGKINVNQIAKEAILWNSVEKYTDEYSMYWTKYNIKEGTYKDWYENESAEEGYGQIFEECFYSQGKKEGHCKFWWPDGQIMTEYFCIRDKKEGCYKEWYANGRIGIKCFYSKGKKEGFYRHWYANGLILKCCNYKNDVAIN